MVEPSFGRLGAAGFGRQQHLKTLDAGLQLAGVDGGIVLGTVRGAVQRTVLGLGKGLDRDLSVPSLPVTFCQRLRSTVFLALSSSTPRRCAARDRSGFRCPWAVSGTVGETVPGQASKAC